MTSALASLPRMTSEEFLEWSARQTDDVKYELHGGVVVPKGEYDEATGMAGERRLHGLVKNNINLALFGALKLPCRPYVDGLAIRVSDSKSYIPDVLVDCGAQEDMQAMTASQPVIVIEVLSHSTAQLDTGEKLAQLDTGEKLEAYFRVPEIQHYLLVDGSARRVTHHQRQDSEMILTRILHDGPLALDPPNVTIEIADFWRGLPPLGEGASS